MPPDPLIISMSTQQMDPLATSLTFPFETHRFPPGFTLNTRAIVGNLAGGLVPLQLLLCLIGFCVGICHFSFLTKIATLTGIPTVSPTLAPIGTRSFCPVGAPSFFYFNSLKYFPIVITSFFLQLVHQEVC